VTGSLVINRGGPNGLSAAREYYEPARRVLLADMDGDGRLDVVQLRMEYPATTFQVEILRNVPAP
jgi:hypothetical protein